MTQQQFIRQTHNTSFVAYEAQSSRKPVALAVNGEPVESRINADVFINEYISIKVKEVSEGNDTVNVKFDAASAVTGSEKKMRYDFGANLKADSPLVGLARQAQAEGRPVYVSIETRRKWKNRDGQVIAYTTPIHVLRGCKDGPQSPGNSNETGNNCSKVIAAMGFADEPNATLVSDEARSNPFKWPNFRDNHDGDLAPTGFVIPTGPNGEPVGGIIPAPAPQATTAASPELVDKLDALTKMVAHLQKSSTAGGGEKPWNDRTADGSVNPGSYAVTQVRHTRGDAAKLVAAVAPDDADSAQLRAWELEVTRALLWAADQVQQAVTGGVNRMAKAHTEAGAWVAHVIRHEDGFTVDLLTDAVAKREWIKRIRQAAFERYMEALELTQEHLDAQSGVRSPAPAGREAAPANNQQTQAEAPQQAANTAQETPQAVTTLADDPEAQQMWDELIEAIDMVHFIPQLNPALDARFGTHLAVEIPADDMRAALSEWMADPAAFRTWAADQFKAVQQPQNQAA